MRIQLVLASFHKVVKVPLGLSMLSPNLNHLLLSPHFSKTGCFNVALKLNPQSPDFLSPPDEYLDLTFSPSQSGTRIKRFTVLKILAFQSVVFERLPNYKIRYKV